LINWKQLKVLFRLRGLLRASSSGDVSKIVEEVFRDAPKEVREVVEGVLAINIENRDPREVAREIGLRLGIKEEDLDDFVDTIMMIAEEVKEYLRPREK
jgi:predicted Zn-dependent protease with MMP-like domain